jgi:uncharacterized membrane protein
MQKKENDKKTIIILFFIGSFVGWIIDTAYRSLTDGTFSHAGYFEYATGFPIPFLPIYGLGLVLIYFLRPLASQRGIAARTGIYAAALTGLEYLGGMFTTATLGIPLWDYSKSIWNLNGYVDITHTIFWVVLAFAADYGMTKMIEKINAGKNILTQV